MRRRPVRKASVRQAVEPAQKNLAAMERSLYNGILRIRKTHRLERLGIAFYDSQTTLQWSFNADTLFHAASTIKIAVLVGVYAQVSRGELAADSPVHVRNRFTSIVDGKPFSIVPGPMDAEVAKREGRTMSVHDLAYEMITKSSNLATNLLIDVVGIDTIKKCLEELRIDGIVMVRGSLGRGRVPGRHQQPGDRQRRAAAAADDRRRARVLARGVRADAGDHARHAGQERDPGRGAGRRERGPQDRQHLDRAPRRRHRLHRQPPAVLPGRPHPVPRRRRPHPPRWPRCRRASSRPSAA